MDSTDIRKQKRTQLTWETCRCAALEEKQGEKSLAIALAPGRRTARIRDGRLIPAAPKNIGADKRLEEASRSMRKSALELRPECGKPMRRCVVLGQRGVGIRQPLLMIAHLRDQQADIHGDSPSKVFLAHGTLWTPRGPYIARDDCLNARYNKNNQATHVTSAG